MEPIDEELEVCAYCDYEGPVLEFVPAIDDDSSWARLAQDHASDCEWIMTRAHRINPLIDGATH